MYQICNHVVSRYWRQQCKLVTMRRESQYILQPRQKYSLHEIANVLILSTQNYIYGENPIVFARWRAHVAKFTAAWLRVGSEACL